MNRKVLLAICLFLCATLTSSSDCGGGGGEDDDPIVKEKEYNVTIDYGFGKVETTSYKQYERVNIPSLNDTEQDGTEYIFCGWVESKDEKPKYASLDIIITSDKTYYAIWKKKCYIYFNDLISTSKNMLYSNVEGEELNTSGVNPYAYLEPYYVFKGWSTDGKEGNIVSKVSYSEKPLYLYAVWEQKIFAISFDLNGGTGTKPANVEIKKGEFLAYTSLPTTGFTYGVYTFEGWSETKNGNVITSDFKPEKNMTLYAVWSHNGQVKDKTDDN